MRYKVTPLWETKNWPYDKPVFIFFNERDDDNNDYMLATLIKGDATRADLWHGVNGKVYYCKYVHGWIDPADIK